MLVWVPVVWVPVDRFEPWRDRENVVAEALVLQNCSFSKDPNPKSGGKFCSTPAIWNMLSAGLNFGESDVDI